MLYIMLQQKDFNSLDEADIVQESRVPLQEGRHKGRSIRPIAGPNHASIHRELLQKADDDSLIIGSLRMLLEIRI